MNDLMITRLSQPNTLYVRLVDSNPNHKKFVHRLTQDKIFANGSIGPASAEIRVADPVDPKRVTCLGRSSGM